MSVLNKLQDLQYKQSLVSLILPKCKPNLQARFVQFTDKKSGK